MKTRREILEEFVVQEPGDSFSRYALALELEKEGRPTDGIPHLEEVVLRDPTYIPAYYQLGRLLGRAGRIEEARTAYSNGLKISLAAGDQKTSSEIQEALNLLD
jgi:predicted Zn-dependent protease